MSNTKQLSTIEQEHRLIIDTYLSTGKLNGTKAIMSLRPDIEYTTARSLFNAIVNSPKNKAYIEQRRNEMRANAIMSSEAMIERLEAVIDADPMLYIGLNKDELKELPHEISVLVQDIEYKEKIYKDRAGNEIKEVTTKVKMQNKDKAKDMLNKMLGNYEINNRQKSNTTNYNTLIQGMNTEELKALATVTKLISQQGKD